MFFIVDNKYKLSADQLRTNTLLDAFYIIEKYPLRASDIIMDQYIQQQYKVSLKNMCVKLLLNLTFCTNDEGGLVLVFKDMRHDKIARLITYGNGAIPGSNILQTALRR